MHNPERIWTLVVYLRSDWDTEFSIGKKARDLGLNFEELVEHGAIDLSVFKEIIELIKKNRIDIVHSRDYKTNLYALIIKRFFCRNIKIVTTAHGWVGSGLKLDFYHFIDKILVASFDRNFILFKDMVKLFIRKPKQKNIVVIHNAIDPEFWSPHRCEKGSFRKELAISDRSKIIGFVGRIMPEKDIITMVEVANTLINKKQIDAYFVLVGECKNLNYDREISQKVSSFKLEKRFLRIGTRSELLPVYVDFDVFLMTSVQEGFPNSLLEAMAMKVPSVVTAIDGIPEIIKHKESGILCKEKDIKGFVDGIELVLNDKRLCSSIITNARSIVEKELSFTRRLCKMEEEYERLLTFCQN
jgi:glycosyltransferase involved in cell wall biosynthesis